MSDISDVSFKDKYLPFIHDYDTFIVKNLVPEAIAYYLSEAKKQGCLVNSSLKNHIGSALDSFNIDCDIDSLIPLVSDILIKKYRLKVSQINPLILDKICKELYQNR